MNTGILVLDEAKYGCAFSFEFEALGGVLVAALHSGSATYRRGPRSETFGPGDLTFLTPEPGPWTGTVRTMQATGVILDPAVIGDSAPAGARSADRPVRFTARKPCSPAAAQLVRAALYFLRDGVLANPFARESPLMVASAGRVLADALLAAFPNDAVGSAPALSDTRDAGGATVDRAVRFIEENAHRDLRLADIARAARVTPRALQYAFARHADCSPHGQLRRVRLDRAHADLKAADPADGLSVAKVAARWGFTNAGRFAAAYRAAYGVSPSTTLRYW
ncbi:AraC family transcriptional regulator [Streptomyces sp. NPDC097619]|uniref:helix-turn-helix transcriptional regulator n=1 Tax=Streptomyces sp. NPDC097619 TaxID=3157228 RepID=UPI00332422F4